MKSKYEEFFDFCLCLCEREREREEQIYQTVISVKEKGNRKREQIRPCERFPGQLAPLIGKANASTQQKVNSEWSLALRLSGLHE